MTGTDNQNTLVSRIIKTENIRWQDLVFLQADDFKELSPEDEQKLRTSVLTNQFTDPFKVWYEELTNTHYCLDGRHRSKVLLKMKDEGIEVPDLLPGTFIDCKDKQDAAKLVLQYSSQYARTTESGLMGFMEDFNLSVDDVPGISIPDIDMRIVIGDLGKDFSNYNEELNVEEFADEIILKLIYTREEYITIKQLFAVLMAKRDVTTPEELIKLLLQDVSI